MKQTACIYTSNTGVGLIADVNLLYDLLEPFYDIDIVYFEHNIGNDSEYNPYNEYDVGIFIQNFYGQYLDRNKKNIFIANEEWIGLEVHQLYLFDKIIVKSEFAKQLLAAHNRNIVNCGFVSYDKYDSKIDKTDTFFHLVGKSYQKGTEQVLSTFNKTNLPLTIVESLSHYNKTPLKDNINFIADFLPKEEVTKQLNSNRFHLCVSYYEGWGHFLYEGLSTGAIAYVSNCPMYTEWLDPELVVFINSTFTTSDNNKYSTYPFFQRPKHLIHQFGWVVDEGELLEKTQEWEHFKNTIDSNDVRDFVKNVNRKNSKKLTEEILNT